VYLIKSVVVMNMTSTFIINLLILLLCAVVGIILYFVLVYLLKIEECMYLWNVFREKIIKR
jgi:putative peptidoglycan lipid II flippase